MLTTSGPATVSFCRVLMSEQTRHVLEVGNRFIDEPLRKARVTLYRAEVLAQCGAKP